MNKLPVIIVALDASRIEEILSRIKFDAVIIVALIVENGEQRTVEVGDLTIPTCSMLSIEDFLVKKTDFVWLLSGSARLDQMRQFLTLNGIPDDFIVDFNVRLNQRWLDAIQSIGDKTFFVTGDQTAVDGIDCSHFVGANGINLADNNQDLCQSFFTARYVLNRNQSMKFALITITPHSLFVENRDNTQYIIALQNMNDTSVRSQLIVQIYNPTVDSDTPIEIDDFSAQSLATWHDTLDEITVETHGDAFNRNLDHLENYLKLCIERGVKPIAIILPFTPIIRQQYSTAQLSITRQALRQLEMIYKGFALIDLFDVPLGYDCFRDVINLNPRGAQLMSALINFKLHNQDVLPFEELADVTYQNFFGLSALLMMDSYNKLLPRVFEVTASRLRRRAKIKVGFLLYDASMWCGDRLYQLFNQNERYEPTVFLCLRQDMIDEKNFVDDFKRGAEQLRSRGLNVVAITDNDAPPHNQDVMICLMPYFEIMPTNYQLENWTARTLAIYIPYGMHISGDAHVKLPDYPIMTLAWKVFLDTRETLDFYENGCRFGLPRGFYSGYPRMDYFFDDSEKHFEWKQSRPNATKIIYAPHWSIDNGIEYSTFHLNYKFIYDYAKSHPKTSWVFKPHPNLAYSAVSSGLFRSVDEYNDYVRKWERLPNAKVVTGGYYQSIFATSDGMILDSGSFNAEYQYTHKPLLFLTRETQQFTDIGAALMNVLYRADGRDHKAIAAFIENVLIKKRDTMAAARKKFFDEHFNYQRDNDMLASDYIFNAVNRELNGGI